MPKQTPSRQEPDSISTCRNILPIPQDVNTSSTVPQTSDEFPRLRTIQSYGDTRFLVRFGNEEPALAINPKARPNVVLSASLDRLTRIRDILTPYGYGNTEDFEMIPHEEISALLGTLGEMAGEAQQLLEHGLSLREIADRDATRCTAGGEHANN